VKMIPGSARNWIAVNAVQTEQLYETETKSFSVQILGSTDFPLGGIADTGRDACAKTN